MRPFEVCGACHGRLGALQLHRFQVFLGHRLPVFLILMACYFLVLRAVYTNLVRPLPVQSAMSFLFQVSRQIAAFDCSRHLLEEVLVLLRLELALIFLHMLRSDLNSHLTPYQRS